MQTLVNNGNSDGRPHAFSGGAARIEASAVASRADGDLNVGSRDGCAALWCLALLVGVINT